MNSKHQSAGPPGGINVKSKFILNAYHPMTDQEKEVFSLETPGKEVVILGRKYVIVCLKEYSNGAFEAELIPVVDISIRDIIKT